jgi:hypothetical protein
MRQDNEIYRAKEFRTLLQSIRQRGITEAIFEHLNSITINNKLRYIPNHILDLGNPVFNVPRHTLIDFVNREIAPFKANFF